MYEDASDEDLDGDQTQDELVPSPSEYDDYSGLSDDLDLGIEGNGDEEEDEDQEAMNGSDDDDVSHSSARLFDHFDVFPSSSSSMNSQPMAM